jgi:hypothetical protein
MEKNYQIYLLKFKSRFFSNKRDTPPEVIELRKLFNVALYSYVVGKTATGYPILQAIRDFLAECKITELDYPFRIAKLTYYRQCKHKRLYHQYVYDKRIS